MEKIDRTTEDDEEESIKTLNFGVRGLQRKRELVEERYARAKARKNGLKTVRTRRKIRPDLRRQLLKNYGFAVQTN
ncbi:MAG: hypothetical protein NT016_02970 [Candidatus Aenigmarchaeota archaeon]|nr:hypothetical protein [Candidatus Aenigmarchaeota archaeon]